MRVKILGVTVEIINGMTTQAYAGNYRDLRSECLVNIVEDLYLKNNTVLSESTANPKDVVANIESSRSTLQLN